MTRSDLAQTARQFSRAHKHKQIRLRILSMLSCIVVFITTYAMILPAITSDALDLRQYLTDYGGHILSTPEIPEGVASPGVTYGLNLEIHSPPAGFSSGLYFYKLPPGVQLLNVFGTDLISIDNILVGNWVVDGNQTVIFDFNDSAQGGYTVIPMRLDVIFDGTAPTVALDGGTAVNVMQLSLPDTPPPVDEAPPTDELPAPDTPVDGPPAEDSTVDDIPPEESPPESEENIPEAENPAEDLPPEIAPEEPTQEDSTADEPIAEDTAEPPVEDIPEVDVSNELSKEEPAEEIVENEELIEAPEEENNELPVEEAPSGTPAEETPDDEPVEENPLPEENLPADDTVWTEVPTEDTPVEDMPLEDADLNSVAEQGDPEAVQALIDSGFFTYWSHAADNQAYDTYDSYQINSFDRPMMSVGAPYINNGFGAFALGDTPSSSQITAEGGSNNDGEVTVSKTISGTDIENVFDITLNVNTTASLTKMQTDPNMAVVIVMDISNTMNSAFGDSTRYQSAMLAAEAFIDEFVKVNNGYSRIGYVAFNTDAHEIFGLSDCSSQEQANALKNTMRTETGKIIASNDYGNSHKRFTNVEAGLKMGHDMLEKSGYTNKYIIFLSDGFPTTYVKSGYTGYDPYTSGGTKGADGVFYDYVTGYYCSYGTSYSDKAAIRAREQATEIKNAGAKIFSVGIDIGGQTIAGYDGRSGLSVIDRTSSTYEIGSASSKDAYKNWLGSSIGSGYYYDSTNTAGLIQAYRQIFNELKTLTEEQNSAKWIASDPMPLNNIDGEPIMEFIGFYDKAGDLQVYDNVTGLVGSSSEGGENTISFDGEKNAISWDLKNSGYATTDSNSAIQYGYQVVYRVRLKNELNDFVENQPYNTNGETTLVYRHVEIENGVVQISQDKTINFPIPAVKGYLGELTFKKVTPDGSPLQGAVFELRHDEISCPYCRGDGLTYVAEVENHIFTASSGADGIVSFTKIPSGHTYSLVETVCPEGYYTDGSAYSVVVAYDNVTVTETYLNGSERVWNLTGGDTLIIANQTSVELPETGSSGELIFYILSVTAAAAALLTGGGVLLFRRKHSVRR